MNFVGQEINRSVINNFVKNDCFPRFVVIEGVQHSGRKYLAKYISKQLDAVEIYAESGVEGVRQCISNAYKTPVPVCYILRSEDLTVNALNSLLKVTEEPPKQAYFIIIVNTKMELTATLRSRCQIIEMEDYTKSQLWHFSKDEKVLYYANTPGMCKILSEINLEEMEKFCLDIVEKIGKVSGVNSLKIPQKFKLKDSDDGYDLDVFFYLLKQILFQKALESKDCLYFRYFIETIKCKSDLNRKGIKKDSILDMWIMKLRDIYNEEESNATL